MCSWKKVLRPGLIKGHWTEREDKLLHKLVQEGPKNWGQVAAHIPGRTAKQCRERWCNHLDPRIKKGGWSAAEDATLMRLFSQVRAQTKVNIEMPLAVSANFLVHVSVFVTNMREKAGTAASVRCRHCDTAPCSQVSVGVLATATRLLQSESLSAHIPFESY